MTPAPSPLVTVIIATYNRADTLRYAIESVLWQTFTDFELWVIGDCCTDHSERIVRGFSHDGRVNWYNMPSNSGYQSKPNNEGIRRAKGKYIAYLNHDDVWLPNHLADTIGHMAKTDADIVFSIIEWVYAAKDSIPDIPLLPDLPIPPEATAVVHRKSIIDTIGFWKDVHETYSYPRVDFFRQAQFHRLRFGIVPSLTALKFLWNERSYHDVGPQPAYMERVRREPDFAKKELAAMLIGMERSLYAFPAGKRLMHIIFNPLRRLMLKWKIDPAALRFWQRKGTQINVWRKRHGLSAVAKEHQAVRPATRDHLRKKASLQ